MRQLGIIFALQKIFRNLFWFAGNLPRWLAIGCAQPAGGKAARVFYGFDRIPHDRELSEGGIVKVHYLQRDYPNALRDFNLLYLVSSCIPRDWCMLLRLARWRGAKIIVNQNGVGYPGWHGPGWEKFNRLRAVILAQADYVFFQSQFCRQSSEIFLGKREHNYEILYNAVDTEYFTPAAGDPAPGQLVLLLGGTQYQYYRIETALRTVAVVVRSCPNVRLLVTGRLCWISDEAKALQMAKDLAADLGILEKVVFLGPYTQAQAPSILRQAHLLIHTKYNDPCPTLVLEAMACGLPVVYSHSGGVPELVGEEAGIGVPAQLSWERDYPPDPEIMAQAVLMAAARRTAFAQAARRRVIERFDLKLWRQRHRLVFEKMTG